MKMASIILGVLGALAVGFLGMKWMSDFGSLNEMERLAAQAQLAAQGGSLDKMITASFIMIAGFFVGLAGVFMSLKERYALAGGLMLGAGILPPLFAPQTFIFTALLIAAGVVAFIAHSKRNAAHA
ncbi:hypothetical protein GCM10007972_22530 [Iodidimonas muriae]|uniref:DUF4064 domain-containing protein n=1 Tax=Iodidimonas muriae TaxID=261467 RepID=A0ABQ2LH81_9PROT|nr:hypothetical protein [Iodidimonas muriae]GER07736.1 hypothetical protein JCM17843_20460 [Kordiimonadales bacterium JCM 17843]GGO14917.1 hypothetical protein GCM10007972_22530 [Iodidimonas muriae]